MTEPITLEEAKQHLRVVTDDDDALIGNLIPAAREYAENYQNRIFASDDPEVEVEVPGALEKAAMLLLIGHLYENREAVNIGNTTTEVPLGVKNLLYFNRKVPV